MRVCVDFGLSPELSFTPCSQTAIYAQGVGLGASKGKELGKYADGYSGYVHMAQDAVSATFCTGTQRRRRTERWKIVLVWRADWGSARFTGSRAVQQLKSYSHWSGRGSHNDCPCVLPTLAQCRAYPMYHWLFVFDNNRHRRYLFD